MSVTPVFAQIPEIKPEAPPFFSDLVGSFNPLWWLLLVIAFVAFMLGFLSYRGIVQLRVTEEFPLMFFSPMVAVLAVVALTYGT
ncbi:hypothetical protein HBA53_23775 (plasmid) [Rhodococcus pyridinivorans]|uniref:hypothetical protein n=1 Tax=Rhodococcus TaxID=1827 RepID=UPI001C30C990|nr:MULTISPECIES: hypothetical protein [Rhodococcus]MBX4170947.1 hypothetical protein [Rhodococcus sp. DMU2021]QXF84134.1 hypothetical protein HBA53_23775 [Rhodococcus pyridinivorans]